MVPSYEYPQPSQQLQQPQMVPLATYPMFYPPLSTVQPSMQQPQQQLYPQPLNNHYPQHQQQQQPPVYAQSPPPPPALSIYTQPQVLPPPPRPANPVNLLNQLFPPPPSMITKPSSAISTTATIINDRMEPTTNSTTTTVTRNILSQFEYHAPAPAPAPASSSFQSPQVPPQPPVNATNNAAPVNLLASLFPNSVVAAPLPAPAPQPTSHHSFGQYHQYPGDMSPSATTDDSSSLAIAVDGLSVWSSLPTPALPSPPVLPSMFPTPFVANVGQGGSVGGGGYGNGSGSQGNSYKKGGRKQQQQTPGNKKKKVPCS